MKKILLLGLLTILAMPAVGEELTSQPVDNAAVKNAQERWAYARLTNYQYTLTSRENWGASATALIIVKNGMLESAGIIIRRSHPTPENEATEASGLRKTINGLFEEMLSRDNFLRAEFDGKTGRPINIWYQHEEWDGAENQYEIRDFAVNE